MVKIVVVTHEYDFFFDQRTRDTSLNSRYLLFPILKLLEQRGHTYSITDGPRADRGDLAILHVDCTQVGDDYLALAAHYPIGINFRASDISKRRLSGALLSRDDKWAGPVIVKSNLNYGGRPEADHNRRALRAGRPPPHPSAVPLLDYVILRTMLDVTDAVWNDHSKVVERFLREQDLQDGYALRTWVFMGPRERCSRHVSLNPIVKASNSFSRTPVEVPHALRVKRALLGLDYGKFDFVVYDGEPVLLDANRTLGAPTASEGFGPARAQLFADGIEDVIRDPSQADSMLKEPSP